MVSNYAPNVVHVFACVSSTRTSVLVKGTNVSKGIARLLMTMGLMGTDGKGKKLAAALRVRSIGVVSQGFNKVRT